MEEDFRLTADTLPDTQNAGSLYTQSQDVGDCQPPDIWGRLCPHLDTLSFRGKCVIYSNSLHLKKKKPSFAVILQ